MVDYTGVAGLSRARDRVGSSLFDKGVQLINAVAKYVYARYQCMLPIRWAMLVM